MKSIAFLMATLAIAQDHPTGPRQTPPTIRQVVPLGIARGMTVEMTVEGFNLAGATRAIFNEPGVTAKILRVKELPDLPDIRLGSAGTQSTIDLGPLPPRNQVTMEVDVSPDAGIGPVSFRLETPMGLSPVGTFLVEPFYGEAPDNEPNDTLDTAFETFLPAILAGAISKPGDVDLFKIRARAGQSLTFENSPGPIGSQLQAVIEIVDSGMAVLASYTENAFAHRFETAGTYYIRVSDYQRKGSAGHMYRIKVGEFPIVTRTYPLGIPHGKDATVQVTGENLGVAAVTLKGQPTEGYSDLALVRVNTPAGPSFNRVRLAIGEHPEVEAAATKKLNLPVTVNGTIQNKSHEFRFDAKKGQEIVFEVTARRLGSKLDSVVEVLHADGKPVERATIRPVWETIIALRDHDSASRGIRIQSWNAMKVGDYVQMDSEILRIEALPKTPDDDCIFESFNGQRIAYFGTSPEAHAIDSPVYKVLVFPPGQQFSPNGLPLTRLTYRNDDGGPGYGKDSHLTFVAPSDGEYIVRLGDVQGLSGDDYAYRLTARAPRPDYRLSIAPSNVNVPRGGTVPLTVTAQRIEGFDDAIEVQVQDLPAGLTATTGVIGKGQNFGTILLSAAQDIALSEAVPLRAVGRAGSLIREANPEDRLQYIAVAPKPDITMTAVTREIEIEAGGTADVKVSIERHNGFGGRVPVEVRNLPPSVRVLDVGLNGVLLNEDEAERSFTLRALDTAEPLEQLIYVSGAVETRAAGQQNSFAAPQAIRLKVKPAAKVEVSSVGAPVVAGAPKN
jgi:hypothetical protein